MGAVFIKLPALFGIALGHDAGFYARNVSLFVLPLLTGYFAWKRRLNTRTLRWLAVSFVAAGVVANVYPFVSEGSTELLTALHLPIALWLAVGIAYAGGRWNQVSGRMDCIRFSGELFIYYVLIALGSGVLTGFMALIFQAIGVDIERDALIAFDLLLLVVVGLLLYSISARDRGSSPGIFDLVQVVLVVSALLIDAVALWAIAARITDFGFSPNRTAALGMNVILLVNLAWSAVLSIRFLRGSGSFAILERWLTDYQPVYAGWAALVVLVFPPVFGYI